jgi:hypothetical protein
MRRFVAFLFAMLLISPVITSCGSIADGTDGRPGPQGDEGEDGVDGSDGQDGKPGEPGEPGRDGQDATGGKLVIAHTHCELSAQTDPTSDGYPKFELLYEITVFNDESAMASMVEKQYFRAGSQPNVTSNTRFYVKAEPGYNKAMVESTMWKAELSTATQVQFSYKPGNFNRSVACK